MPQFIPILTPQTGGTFKQVLVEAISVSTGLVGSPPSAPQDAGKIVRLNANGQIDSSLGGGSGGGGGGSVISVNGQMGVVVLQLPQTFTPVTTGSPPEPYEFLTGYNASTGLFTAGTPAYSAISGTPNLSVYALLSGAVFAGNVTLGAELIDGASSHGTSGQILSSTGTGTAWVPAGGGAPNTEPIVYGRTVALNVAITSTGSTTFDAPAMSPAPAFITIDTEQMSVTSIVGTTWTVGRADGGTVAATHLIGATVTEMLWSFFNWQSGNQLFTGTSSGLFFNAVAQSSGQDWVIGMKTAIGFAGSPWTVIMKVDLQPQLGTDYYGAGIFLQKKGQADALMCEIFQHESNWYWLNGIDYWPGSGFAASATGGFTINSWLQPSHPNQIPDHAWIKAQDDGTTYLIYSWSPDGVVWVPICRNTRNADITNPDYVGIYASPRGGAYALGCSSITISSP